jgi:16S rRNA (guanine(966)-N(2))-methyltransferase RsmD
MRVIAGALTGRRLQPPDWPGLRPTSDRLRETLFNVLGGRVEGARVLDAFAGTGAVGIEALSRGAAHVTFLEQDPRACRLIDENLRRCRVSDGYTMVRASLARALGRQDDSVFDVIFLDPPYEEPDLEGVVAAAMGRLVAGGVAVLEHAARRTAPEPGGCAPTRRLRAGDSALAFYEAGGGSSQGSGSGGTRHGA